MIKIVECREETLDDLCKLCVPSEKWDDPAFLTGIDLKRTWGREKLNKWGTCAKLAYKGSTPVGLLQYEPFLDEQVINIHCIYVPNMSHSRQGIATELLSHLIEEAKRPQPWFSGRAALALCTKTFPGERPGLYPARAFFRERGFQTVEDNPDLLYYPLQPHFVYQLKAEAEGKYILQVEDRGKAILIYGPSFCPFSYPFLKMAEELIHEIDPQIPVQWINWLKEPKAVAKRGGFTGCIVNGKVIEAYVLETDCFKRAVTDAIYCDGGMGNGD